MAWCTIGIKSLPKPMLTKVFNEACFYRAIHGGLQRISHAYDFSLTEHSNTTSDTWRRVLLNIQTFAQESVFKCIQNFQQFAPTPTCFICEVLKNRNAVIKVNNPLTPGRCGRNFNSSDVGDGIFQLCGVNTKPADALAAKVAKASADMVFQS